MKQLLSKLFSKQESSVCNSKECDFVCAIMIQDFEMFGGVKFCLIIDCFEMYDYFANLLFLFSQICAVF